MEILSTTKLPVETCDFLGALFADPVGSYEAEVVVTKEVFVNTISILRK